MRKYTSSEITTFRTCRRQWWLRYYRKLAPIRTGPEVSAAGLGTMVHAGLELYYLQREQIGDRMPTKVLTWLDNFTTDQRLLVPTEDTSRLKKFDQQAALARVMLEGYFEWLEESGADADLEYVAVERAVEVELSEGVSLLGKLDAKVRRRSTGEILFLDNKTVQSIDSTVEAAYRSNQFRHYALLEYIEHQRGLLDSPQAGGVIVNMLRKVGRGPASKPPYYGRHTFSFNEKVVLSYWEQVAAEIQRIRDAEAALGLYGQPHQVVVPPSPSRDCSWRCEFKTICPMFDDGSDVESMLAFGFETHNPLERYSAEEKESAE